jgi:hypothetical protein
LHLVVVVWLVLIGLWDIVLLWDIEYVGRYLQSDDLAHVFVFFLLQVVFVVLKRKKSEKSEKGAPRPPNSTTRQTTETTTTRHLQDRGGHRGTHSCTISF